MAVLFIQFSASTTSQAMNLDYAIPLPAKRNSVSNSLIFTPNAKMTSPFQEDALKHFVALSILSFSLAAAAQSAPGYHVINRIPVPGTGSWDYLTVDESARRLYVSHGTQVEVLDVDSGAIVGKVPNTPGVHGIAIVSKLGRGFISDGQSSTVTIFDLKTLKTIGE